MKRNYYLVRSGRLRRKKNTLYLESGGEKTPIPVNQVSSLYAFGELDVNSKLMTFLTQKNIPIHFFNYYGYYSGSYYPREYLQSGMLLVKQVEHYLDDDERLNLAREFVRAASYNILKNLKYYEKRGKEVGDFIEAIECERKLLNEQADVGGLMGVEGRIRDHYYGSFDRFLRGYFKLEKRVKRPPDNMMNCSISFGNSLMYTSVLTEIYHTQLNPTISYLHEPSERRFSLSLDLSEVFKPVIVDRLIFKLANNQMLKEKHFLKELNYCYLNDEGKKVFLREYDERLRRTVKHKRLGRKVSYKRLLRLECYKLIKHILGEQEYEGFKRWW